VQRFLVIIEKTKRNYSAYCPDLPGCVATGRTREEVLQRMKEAIYIHLQALKEEGRNIPKSQSLAEYVILK
jgi:predicted RNase H-like HicB family nuclease